MRLLFVFSFLSSFVWSQLPTSPNNGIPDDWLGSYEGVMEIYNNNGLQQKIGVNFDLQVMDRPNYWTYNMSFINLKNNELMSTKAYKVFYEEQTNKLWMDEGDSLLIEMTLMGDCLFDHYTLSDLFFNSTLCHQNEGLVFQISGGKLKPSYTSPYIEEADGSVATMQVNFLQRVLLLPKK
jgi:hypothetical protein